MVPNDQRLIQRSDDHVGDPERWMVTRMARQVVLGDWNGLEGNQGMGSSTNLEHVDRSGMLFLPIRGKPKARPRVVKGNTYMPANYTAFKEKISIEMLDRGLIPSIPHAGPLSLEAIFGTDGMWFQLRPVPGHERAKHMKADVDNLLGGLMDALQDATVLEDDKQIIEVHGWIDRRPDGKE